MMPFDDIIQLIVLCMLIFFPLGWLARHLSTQLRHTFRLLFFKPRYLKPAGILRRTSRIRADKNHD